VSSLEFPPPIDFDTLRCNLRLLPDDAAPTVDERAPPFLLALCARFGVGVEYRILAAGSHKIGLTILLDPGMPLERQHWSFCHELAHILLGHDNSSVPSEEEERAANQIAAELLLPRTEFAPVAREPLAALKERFPNASWEVLLRRRLQFHNGVGTIFDEGKMTFRAASPGRNCPLQPLAEELETVREAYRNAAAVTRNAGGLRMTADYVDTTGVVRRVLLWTDPEAEE